MICAQFASVLRKLSIYDRILYAIDTSGWGIFTVSALAWITDTKAAISTSELLQPAQRQSHEPRAMVADGATLHRTTTRPSATREFARSALALL